ncbi:outer membrane receptor protein [Belliella baltica DSM 15883]|uniref:Outer membrane receptor protein n=1 Tax=Belliella baltica (strain DSM 15883 / CIP 108006 / LMG 21964 / BA134) TaxID=866536 RepID=I3ZA42_BELBD|nr:outer membrane beta-barrel family protein [Belliella baltica]AFL86110.1 outer membrane receptor protein [Belliella baltica DSM 15883]
MKTFNLSVFTLTLIIFLWNSNLVFSQNNENQYNVTGKIIDSESKETVPFVQVAFFKPGEEEPVAYSDTNIDGVFNLKLPASTYNLRLYLIGYERQEIENINVNKNLNLQNIEIFNEGENLEEVVVESSKILMRTNVEGITINPSANLSNIGGTLLDILRNTPSVRVGDDGGISLRGSTGTNVLINGRNSSLTQNLDQIPASAIEQIRIINNPNARYDAEAEGGIIDIVLKKGDDLGTNGGAELTYGTRGRMNTGARFNHRTIKYNVYAGYNLRRWRDVGNRRIEREIFGDGEKLNQETGNRNENLGHTFNYGADYYFGKNTISYEGVFSTSLDQQINTLYSRLSTLDSDELVLEYVRRNNESETDDGLENSFIYERSFDDKERSFKFIVSNSYTNQFKTQNIDIFRNASNPNPENLNGQERAFTDEKRYNTVFQTDYIHPLPNQMKLEVGAKSNLRNFDNDYDYSRFNEGAQDFVNDPAISNRFDYKDRIHAGYFVWSKAGEKIDITAGLRGEYTTVDTYLYNTEERNRQEYFNLFPSVQSLYKFSPEQQIKFTYSRRIDRPTAWRLNPFPDITDSLNVRRGNPFLQSEMIHSLELGHIMELKKASLTTNFFYRQVNGLLDFITIIEDGISYSQPENLNTGESYGVELIGLWDLTPWWNLNGSLTGFNIRVDGSNLGEEFVNSGFAWNTKLNSDFKLPLDFTLQLVFNYDSPEIEAQGRDLSQYFIDANIQKSFFNNKGSLALSIRDIFDTRRFAGNSLTNTFSQSFYSKRETRIALFSARYNF